MKLQINPPTQGAINSPDDVNAILQLSCYDCHSNETRWPWYSRTAPVSWLVTRDVHEARDHLNFSEWRLLSHEERAEKLEEIWEEVEEGEMPLWFYVPLHPEARLSAADRATLRAWLQSKQAATHDAADD